MANRPGNRRQMVTFMHESLASSFAGALASLTAASKSSVVVPRVGQLDAQVLDDELFDILKEQLLDGCRFLNSTIRDRYESEILLLLKVLLWKVTVWDHSATYGGLLQNMRLVRSGGDKNVLRQPSGLQKILLGLSSVFGEHVWHKLMDRMAVEDWEESESAAKRRLHVLAKRADAAYDALSLVNFIAFIARGRYPSLLHRILRIRLISSTRALSRQVSFEFLNRQLVWDEFTKFLLFVLPFMHLPKLRRRIGSLFSSVPGRKIFSSKGTLDAKAIAAVAPLSFLPERTCAICFHQDSSMSQRPQVQSGSGYVHNDITNPYAADCGHVYCYVCLVTQIEESDGHWTCLRCNSSVTAAVPWRDLGKEDPGVDENGDADGQAEVVEGSEDDEVDFAGDEDENDGLEFVDEHEVSQTRIDFESVDDV